MSEGSSESDCKLIKEGNNMLVQQFPKPKLKKQRKARYNHIPTINDICRYTGLPYAENHEVFFGKGRRQLSIIYGLQVRVSSKIHADIHAHPLRGLDLDLKKEYQEIFENKYGHEMFVGLFGRDYLSM
jgi:hypothetical protein